MSTDGNKNITNNQETKTYDLVLQGHLSLEIELLNQNSKH